MYKRQVMRNGFWAVALVMLRSAVMRNGFWGGCFGKAPVAVAGYGCWGGCLCDSCGRVEVVLVLGPVLVWSVVWR